MKQPKNQFYPQAKMLELSKYFPRKSHNREFIHKFLVSDQEQLRLNKQILNSRSGDHYE